MIHVRTAALLACALVGFAACKKSSTKDLVSRTFGFEGAIEQETHFLTGMTERTSYKMRGQRVRVDMGRTAMIADLVAQKTYVLDGATKTYSTIDWSTYSTDAGAKPTTRRRTGKKEIIAGYGCDEYESSGPTGDRLLSCVTTEIYAPLALAAGALGAFGDDGFPLRLVTQNPSGVEVFRSEVVRIEKRSIAEADVAIPPGYKEVK